MTDYEAAKCRLCTSMLSFKRASTKGLWDHLKCKHKPEYLVLKQNEEALAPSNPDEFKAPKIKKKKLEPKNDICADNDNSLVSGVDTPQTELIRVRIQSNENRADAPPMNGGADRMGSIDSQPCTSVMVNHILVWSSICSQSAQSTFIMCSLLDGDHHHFGTKSGASATLTYVLQKLGVKPEPSGCFSTTCPVNLVLDELSGLGYRAIGMVNKRADEVLWTLAK
uniref:BED-type domain-containing protein n=1 Tax=Globodera pallida TaxID=36090 RepID=A0A183BM57_GLOPA